MPAPSLTTLHSFDFFQYSGSNLFSSNVFSGLLLDPAGNLFGTTAYGGNGSGTVFQIAASTRAFSTLGTFGNDLGAFPYAVGSLVRDAAGNLYGTNTSGGGGAGLGGTAWEMLASDHSILKLATFSYWYPGADPQGGLVIDAAGNLYGTTAGDAYGNVGVVYEITAGTHDLLSLANFTGGNGTYPQAALAIDSAGNLFGTTFYGGASNAGIVFELTAGSHETTTLTSFNGTNGANPYAQLILDAAGNIYGTTRLGGANGLGTVFEIDAATHTLTTLASFDGTNGANPDGGLLRDAAGNLFGTAVSGGAVGGGTIFRLDAGGHSLNVLHHFTGADGFFPEAGMVADAQGNLYGTTSLGDGIKGTVFMLADAGYVTQVLPTARGGVVVMRADATIDDASFAGLGGLSQLALNGHGAQSVYLGANAETAFAGNDIILHDRAGSLAVTADASGLSAAAVLHAYADTGVAHFTGGRGNDIFEFNAATFFAAGRTVEGGNGVDQIRLNLSGDVADQDFAGLSHVERVSSGGNGSITFHIGAQAQAAFGGGPVVLTALNTSVLTADGSLAAAGFLVRGGNGNDHFIDGAGDDSLYGQGGADLFDIGKGGHDVVFDFVQGDDHLRFADQHFHGMADLAPLLSQRGANAVITLGADSQILVKGIDFHAFTASDFIFG